MTSNFFKNRKEKTQAQGFTLIEVMVSLAIFSIVMLIAVTTLLSLVDANRKAQNLQLVMSNLNFALDHLARSLATGRRYYCTDDVELLALQSGDSLPSGTTDCTSGDVGIVVSNDRGERAGYVFDAGQLFEKVEDGDWVEITSEEVVIDETETRFYVANSLEYSDNEQPYVNIIVKGSVPGVRGAQSEFNIQTMVTQRLLDR